MASGSIFTYRLEFQRNGSDAWNILFDRTGEVVAVSEGSKAAADVVFWALCAHDVARSRFVKHGSMRV